jgi:hypothetical protein
LGRSLTAIAAAVEALAVRTCTIDDDGLTDFEPLPYRLPGKGPE